MEPRTDWKIEWIIRIFLLVFLIAAAVGLFGGQRSPRTAAATEGDLFLEVRYWPVMRPGHRKHIAAVVTNRSHTSVENVNLRLSRRYLRGFDVQGILPEPESQAMTPDRLDLTSGGLDAGEEMEVQIDLYVHRWGRYSGEIEVEMAGLVSEAAKVSFVTVVVP